MLIAFQAMTYFRMGDPDGAKSKLAELINIGGRSTDEAMLASVLAEARKMVGN